MTECAETGCSDDGVLQVRGLKGLWCIRHYTDKVVWVGCTLREMSRIRAARRAAAEDNRPARIQAEM